MSLLGSLIGFSWDCLYVFQIYIWRGVDDRSEWRIFETCSGTFSYCSESGHHLTFLPGFSKTVYYPFIAPPSDIRYIMLFFVSLRRDRNTFHDIVKPIINERRKLSAQQGPDFKKPVNLTSECWINRRMTCFNGLWIPLKETKPWPKNYLSDSSAWTLRQFTLHLWYILRETSYFQFS